MTPALLTHREKAIQWARDIVADPSVVFLDTETTGLGETAEIVDLAIVDIDGTVLFDHLIRPINPIPAEATTVHGITNDDVLSAPTWMEIADQVEAILSCRRVVIYNSQYDTGIIAQVNKAAGREPMEFASECAMLAYGEYDGSPGKFGKGFRWWKLDQAAARFGIDPGGHRALADTLVTRSVVLAMAADTSADELVPVSLLDAPKSQIDPDFWTQ